MYLLIIKLSIISYVYSVILTDDNMILSKWYLYWDRKPDWIFYPIVGCFKCVSGQLALWLGFLLLRPYSLFEHLFLICGTIFFSLIINRFYTWLES
jgi:hypothetical protein